MNFTSIIPHTSDHGGSTAITSNAGIGSEDTVIIENQCPNCASAEARIEFYSAQIANLEAQVQYLTGKASAAVDKLADYEDELANFASRSSSDLPQIIVNQPGERRTSHDIQRKPVPTQAHIPSAIPEKRPSVSNRFHSFLNRRGPTSAAQTSIEESSNLHTSETNGISTSSSELAAQFSIEHRARLNAEDALTSLQAELEELSASLFSQANEMVADERKHRAREEDRASMWEDQAKALQQKWKGAEEQASSWEDKAHGAEARVKDLEGRLAAGGQREMRNKRLEALEKAVAKLEYLRTMADHGKD